MYVRYQELLEGLRGGRGTLSMSSSIPLRKGATCALTGLVKAWLWASGSGGNGSSSSGSGSGGAVLHPPTQLSEALWSFLRDQVSCPSTYTLLTHLINTSYQHMQLNTHLLTNFTDINQNHYLSLLTPSLPHPIT